MLSLTFCYSVQKQTLQNLQVHQNAEMLKASVYASRKSGFHQFRNLYCGELKILCSVSVSHFVSGELTYKVMQ